MIKVYVPWSGGLDSTALIYYYLRKGYKVYSSYVELKNNPEKTPTELHAIANMLPFLEEFSFEWGKITYTSLFSMGGAAIPFAPQPPIWLLNLLFTGLYYKVDRVALGYVSGDKAVSYLPEIKQIFNSYGGLVNEDCTLPELEFPLIKYGKEAIWQSVPENIRRYTVTCEMPRYGLVDGDDFIRPVYNAYLSDSHLYLYEKDYVLKDNESIRVFPCGQCSPCKRRMEVDSDYYNASYDAYEKEHQNDAISLAPPSEP